VQCSPEYANSQLHRGEFALEGKCNDLTQKVHLEPFTWAGFQRFEATIVDKAPAEIEAEKPPEIPFAKRQANITNEQLQSILGRITNLEKK